nr:MAG TPA: hypothetical protein [Bacteriophage sp.]
MKLFAKNGLVEPSMRTHIFNSIFQKITSLSSQLC